MFKKINVNFFLIAFFIFSSFIANAQKVLNYNEFITVETELKSQYFDFNRKIIIGLPPNYNRMTAQDYDVMYVFDAQDRPYFDLVRSLSVFIDTKYESRFIVVGVLSPQDKEYTRQDDFLKIKYPSGHGGYHKNFSLFIQNELMPYIAKNYRITDRKIAVGHSLGGSFSLEALLDYELFTDYITVSPNMFLTDWSVSEHLVNFDYNKLKNNHFIFASDANEELLEKWQNWKPAREKVYNFFETQKPKQITFYHRTYPTSDHMTTVPPALIDGFKTYFAYRDSVDEILTQKEHKVKISLVSKNKFMKDIYITGNQETLKNWNPKGVKLQAENDSIFSIELKLKLPAQFKFTRGSWETEAYIKNSSIPGNLRIETDKRKNYIFEVSSWAD